MTDECPQCASPTRAVTAVTVRALGSTPRTVLITRQCATPGCHHKFVVLKREGDLAKEEREVWRGP